MSTKKYEKTKQKQNTKTTVSKQNIYFYTHVVGENWNELVSKDFRLRLDLNFIYVNVYYTCNSNRAHSTVRHKSQKLDRMSECS